MSHFSWQQNYETNAKDNFLSCLLEEPSQETTPSTSRPSAMKTPHDDGREGKSFKNTSKNANYMYMNVLILFVHVIIPGIIIIGSARMTILLAEVVK